MTVHSSTPTTATPHAVEPISTRARIARLAAWVAAASLLAGFAIGIAAVLTGADISDHSAGLGQASEAVAGLAFIAGAVSLAALAPRLPHFLWWAPAILGLLASGISMIAVVATGSEGPEIIATVEIGLSAVGLMVVGILGSLRRRVWPWWIGLGIALIIPVMFFVPFNSVVLALIWTGVALAAHPDVRS